MKQRILLLIFSALFLSGISFGQGVCGSYKGYLQDDIDKYPDFYKSLEQQNAELEKANKTLLQNIVREKSTEGKKIIPVVVHVIYDVNDAGNTIGAITDAEVQGAIDALNRNINGQAYNFLTGTPDVFAASRGELNVEFRLAKLTPKCDNCPPRPTTGIVRVQSELTNLPPEGNNNIIKTLSYWNSYQYLNIWLAADIPGLNGYAQFPWGTMSTDGVVVRTSTFKKGETITHEVGHWLDLYHTWGGCGYSPPAPCCNDDDGIYDTPNDQFGNINENPVFPSNVLGCFDPFFPNYAGEMFVNYMDYMSDDKQTMFSKDQVEKMNEIFEGEDGEFGWREYMWSDENITATGTADGYVGPTCSMKGEIWNGFPTSSICEGENVWLRSNKNQFDNLTSLSWDLGDNGAGTYHQQDSSIYKYAAPGSYDVTVIFNYNETTEARSSILSDLDTVNSTSWGIVTNTIIVQGTASELIAMGAINIVEHQLDSALDNNNWVDSIGVYWGFQDTSFYRGEMEDTIYVAYYTNMCADTAIEIDFITILDDTATNNAPSYSYSFEDASELGTDWITNTIDNDENIWAFNSMITDKTWEHAPGVASHGSSCVMMAAKDGMVLEEYHIISAAYDLSGFTNPAIKFSWSGAAKNTSPVNELNVEYSKDCGFHWNFLGSLTNIEVANAGLYDSPFKPNTNEWADTVMTKTALKDDNIRFRFEYVTNGSSNNFYIDNIQIGEETSLLQTLDNNAKLAVYPNPTSGLTNILMENLADKDVQVKLMNILGADVKLLFDGSVISKHQTFDTDLSQFEDGIYFISVYSEGKAIITDKIILFK